MVWTNDFRNAAHVAADHRCFHRQSLQADLQHAFVGGRGYHQQIQRPQHRRDILAMPCQGHVFSQATLRNLLLEVRTYRAVADNHIAGKAMGAYLNS